MKPLATWPVAARRELVGVFTDIDDTLTSNAAITPDARKALADLKRAGLIVIAVTGRSSGWCQPLLQGSAENPAWPVDAIVAENGALAWVSERDSRQPRKIYQQDVPTRTANALRLAQVREQVLQAVPSASCSPDCVGRETDIAFDHSEFAHLGSDQIAQVVALMQAAGMNASVSSIHINGWFGKHNKLEGARWIMQELLQRDLDAELGRWAYVGDSSNDQIMFQHFGNSIGVANIARFAADLVHRPRYITPSQRGAGFAEVAHAILSARG